MLRSFYRGVLGLHPTAFRRRFAEEMQSIFDQVGERSARVRLLADGLISLMRQWTLRPEFWHELAPTRSRRPLTASQRSILLILFAPEPPPWFMVWY